ncbi:T-complex protein 1 subunit eta [Rhodotorula toruloides]
MSGRMPMMGNPTVLVLREGTDTSQGTPQLLSNISACLAIANTISSTLGPRGMDKLIVGSNGQTTISNDGATILKLLDVVHPAAKTLVDIARAQDAEVGDGTTSVVLLAAELMREARPFIEDGVSPHVIIKGYRKAAELAVARVKELAVTVQASDEADFRSLLMKCASTSMSSKLIHSSKPFFSNMVVDAVQTLDPSSLDASLIGIKKVPGGGMEESMLVRGVAFKKTFSYAGFEQQPKKIQNPKVLSLNVELELKAERDNAEVRVEQVSEYQAIVDAEWSIIYRKLELIAESGATVVLSRLPIGDLATQYFADRNIFCAGRVASDDLKRVVSAVGGAIQSTVSDLRPEHLGTCDVFEEKQIGAERYNLFEGCPKAKTCTLILRGGAEQFISEVERSLNDAVQVVRRAVKNGTVVAGGGATEMEISAYLRSYARTLPGKQQLIISSYAKALEVIPRTICDNAGLDATDVLNKLRMLHARGETWAGVSVEPSTEQGKDEEEGVANNMDRFVWEPALVKINALEGATEAACVVLSVDETVTSPQAQTHRLTRHAVPWTRSLAALACGILIALLVLPRQPAFPGPSETAMTQLHDTEPPTNPRTLRIGTLNIRYDYHARHPIVSPLKTLLQGSDGRKWGEHRWQERRDQLVDQVLWEELDVVGFQEVLDGQFEDLRESMGAEYGSVGVGRDDGKKAGEAVPIVYRHSRLELLSVSHFWLSPTPEVPGSKGWDAGQPRMCTVARFSDRTSTSSAEHADLIVANTHWDDRGLKAREESAKLILSRIEEEIRAGKSEAEAPVTEQEPLVVLLGDLNSPAEEAGYQVLTGGRYPAGGKFEAAQTASGGRSFFDSRHELVTRGSKLATPGAVSGRFGPLNTYTGFSPSDTPKVIDFILPFANSAFLSPHTSSAPSSSGSTWHVSRYGVVGNFFEDVGGRRAEGKEGERDAMVLSDHRLVVAVFREAGR